jgi:hypothetical protein
MSGLERGQPALTRIKYSMPGISFVCRVIGGF